MTANPGHRPPRTYETYHAHHDLGSSAEYSTTIVHALADVTGADTTDVGSALFERVDPDAPNRLFRPGEAGNGAAVRVVVTLWGYRATAHADGRIVIHAPVRGRQPGSR